MNRQEQKAELIYKLGLLLAPLEDVANQPERHDPDSRTRAAAKFSHDRQEFINVLLSFTQGEPGAVYETQWRKALSALDRIQSSLDDCLHDAESLPNLLDVQRDNVMAALSEVPAFEGSVVLEAHSPFSAYCRLRDLCASATETLTWADRYFDASVFYRFLREVPPSLNVALLTWPRQRQRGRAAEFAAFLDVSRLFANERCPDTYRLVVHDAVHDRWLRCDSEIYELGGSAKDAAAQATAFTLTKLEPPDDILREIEHLLNTGSELYGPTNRTHP